MGRDDDSTADCNPPFGVAGYASKKTLRIEPSALQGRSVKRPFSICATIFLLASSAGVAAAAGLVSKAIGMIALTMASLFSVRTLGWFHF